jgi:hypothetical protein
VFIAHSLLSAIWLLRVTLGDGALPDAGWERLMAIAEEMAHNNGSVRGVQGR